MKDIIPRDFLLETAGPFHAYRDLLSPITQMLDFIVAETHFVNTTGLWELCLCTFMPSHSLYPNDFGGGSLDKEVREWELLDLF